MGDLIYRPLIEDMTWSYSRLTCFDDCKYRWFMHYIQDLREVPMFYSDYGSFMHKLIEKYYRGLLTKDEMKTEFLTEFSNEVRGERPGDKIVQSYIQKGLAYLDEFEPFPFNMIEVESRMNFVLDGVKFVGIIDYIGEKDGEYYIVDNKSRELKPRSNRRKPTVNDQTLDEMLRQLYIYSEAVRQKYGKFPKALCFNCFKNQQFIIEPFQMDRFDEAVRWVHETIENICDDDSFEPNVEYFSCRYICGLHDDCEYWNMR